MMMSLATCIVSGKHGRHMKQQRHECMEDGGARAGLSEVGGLVEGRCARV